MEKKRKNFLVKPRGDAIPVMQEKPGKPNSKLVPYPFGPKQKFSYA